MKLALCLVLVFALTPPAVAHAAGAIVYDPTNAIHNAATAARALESLNNQVKQLEQQALMLTRSPLSQSGEIGQALSSMSSLAKSVTGLTADAARLETQFKTLFPSDLQSRNKLQLITDSLARLNAAKQTAQDLAKIAAELAGRAGDQQKRATAALTASEGAAGQTAAIQSSTQLMGVLTDQRCVRASVWFHFQSLMEEFIISSAASRLIASTSGQGPWNHSTMT